MTKTRFKHLYFEQVEPGLWRVFDLCDAKSDGTGQHVVGPFYRSKDELLADLHRYGTEYGAEDA